MCYLQFSVDFQIQVFDPNPRGVAAGCTKKYQSRFLDDFLHLADCLLDRSRYVFPDTFAFQVGIVRKPAYLFFDRALHFVNLAFDLILGAWFHFGVSSEMI
jgi:hypothetical protein